MKLIFMGSWPNKTAPGNRFALIWEVADVNQLYLEIILLEQFVIPSTLENGSISSSNWLSQHAHENSYRANKFIKFSNKIRWGQNCIQLVYSSNIRFNFLDFEIQICKKKPQMERHCIQVIGLHDEIKNILVDFFHLISFSGWSIHYKICKS
jgi:hypothetical protein